MLRSEHRPYLGVHLCSFSWVVYSSPLFGDKLESNTSRSLQKSELQILCLGNCDDVFGYTRDTKRVKKKEIEGFLENYYSLP